MENKKREIAKLLLRANSVMGGKALTKEYIEITAIKLERFGVETPRFVLDQWIDGNKYMPKLSDLLPLCKKHHSQSFGKTSSPLEKICRFSDPDECKISKSFCKRKDLSEEEVLISNRNFEKTLCDWHHDVMMAKLHPNSQAAKRVERMIAWRTREAELGINPDNFDSLSEYLEVCAKMMGNIPHSAPKFKQEGAQKAISQIINTKVAIK